MRRCAVLVGLIAVMPARGADTAAVEFFETKIRPIFVENCQSCHGVEKQKNGLQLDSAAAVRKGGDSGPVITPGEPDKSRLIEAVRQTGELKMPPKGKLPDEAIAALTEWVKLGAPWPAERDQSLEVTSRKIEQTHWAFQKVTAPRIPDTAVADALGSPRNPIDAFVLAKLQAAGLKPSPAADRATLLRRITLDLHGLPPTPAAVDAFVSDADPDAFAKVVDRLLANPRYGERWGRYWLDVARYADSKGYVFEEERRYPYAYTYRDYVVRSFNDDLPFDEFVIQQLAADRLPIGDDKRPLAALGFVTLGRRFLNNPHDIIDDRIDVVTRGLMGLTVTCARCHDHKYDPIPTADYYSLYGVFASSVEPKDLPQIGEVKRTPEYEAFEKQLAKLEGEVEKYRQQRRDYRVQVSRVASLLPGLEPIPLRAVTAVVPNPLDKLPAARFDRMLNRLERDTLRKIQKTADSFRANSPLAPPRAMVLADAPQPSEPVILVRGNPANHGKHVPRQFPAVIAGPERKPFTDGSGRLELAKAITDPQNPLTARVFVNRVWAHHFGKGLVGTPSDFGVRSDPPTHPELLDYLADRFVKGGWSVKKLHRLILLSNAYQQRSDDRPECVAADPENRLLWKYNRWRLDLEALRDGILAAAGTLDPAIGGPAVDIVKQPGIPRRTIYGFIDRQNLPGMYRTFDFASPDTHAPQRYSTTVPQQALFLMNSPFALQQVKALAARPEVAGVSPDEMRVDALYRLLYGRPPQTDEVELGVRFVRGTTPAAETKLSPWEQYVQVLLLGNEFAFVD